MSADEERLQRTLGPELQAARVRSHKMNCPYHHGGPCDCKPPAEELWAIFDLDGCICDDSHRYPIAERAHAAASPDSKARLYQQYHDRCVSDPIRRPEMLMLLAWRAYQPWHRIALVTARNVSHMSRTTEWLTPRGVMSSVDQIYMRALGDQRPSVEVKREILRRHFETRQVAFAMDDDPRLVEMYKDLRIPVFQCFPHESIEP